MNSKEDKEKIQKLIEEAEVREAQAQVAIDTALHELAKNTLEYKKSGGTKEEALEICRIEGVEGEVLEIIKESLCAVFDEDPEEDKEE